MNDKQFVALVFYIVAVILAIVAAWVPAARGPLQPLALAAIAAGLAVQVLA